MVPLFVSVTLCGALVVPTNCGANVNEETEKTGFGPIPFPVTVIGAICVVEFELMITEPVRVPKTVGANVTLT